MSDLYVIKKLKENNINFEKLQTFKEKIINFTENSAGGTEE